MNPTMVLITGSARASADWFADTLARKDPCFRDYA